MCCKSNFCYLYGRVSREKSKLIQADWNVQKRIQGQVLFGERLVTTAIIIVKLSIGFELR
jgi:hypothetical protein